MIDKLPEVTFHTEIECIAWNKLNEIISWINKQEKRKHDIPMRIHVMRDAYHILDSKEKQGKDGS